jgi:endonuclease-3
MATPSRTALLTKVHKVLKKHYKPFAPLADRTVLEHLLYGCCLENSPPASADRAYARLVDQFFDWNEVRVSTVRELAEAMESLRDSEEAALRVKSCLQSVFESNYSFDLESLRKQNLGQAIKTLKKYKGTSPFVVGYVVQAALGGHLIPINAGGFQAVHVVGAITPAELADQTAPGMERAITKSKGVEFASLLHQFGVDLSASPYGPGPRKILLEIDPNCKERLPKRQSKSAPEPAEVAPKSTPATKGTDKKKAVAADKGKKAAKKHAAKNKKASRAAASATGKKKSTTQKGATSKTLARRKPR